MQHRWAEERLAIGDACADLGRPSRPAEPRLVPPKDVPRRRINRGSSGRIALLHALAHIELNAVDLAADMIARFATQSTPRAFCEDWLKVLDEEGRHFLLVSDRLEALGSHYGAHPAHDGLWEAAETTAGDLMARLAVVPLVLEARGLDVTPAMIAKLKQVEDPESAAVLAVIYEEEIGHVAIGRRWFAWTAEARGLDPWEVWPQLVRKHFRGSLKPPFNHAGREAAGIPRSGYEGLASDGIATEHSA